MGEEVVFERGKMNWKNKINKLFELVIAVLLITATVYCFIKGGEILKGMVLCYAFGGVLWLLLTIE